jgi:predicted small metal-binding protein
VRGQSRQSPPDLGTWRRRLPWGREIVECGKVDPSSGCKHIVRGSTEEEVLKNAAEHAKQHGIREVTPELQAKVKAAIRDEK